MDDAAKVELSPEEYAREIEALARRYPRYEQIEKISKKHPDTADKIIDYTNSRIERVAAPRLAPAQRPIDNRALLAAGAGVFLALAAFFFVWGTRPEWAPILLAVAGGGGIIGALIGYVLAKRR